MGKTYGGAEMNPVIEPGIRPLVDAMNATGVFWTVASCEGHRWRGARPYVYFVAPLEAAASLDVLLEKDIANEKRRLTYYWVVRGIFFRGQIRFHISPPNLAQRHFWSRRKLKNDILVLADLVRQIGNSGLNCCLQLSEQAGHQPKPSNLNFSRFRYLPFQPVVKQLPKSHQILDIVTGHIRRVVDGDRDREIIGTAHDDEARIQRKRTIAEIVDHLHHDESLTGGGELNIPAHLEGNKDGLREAVCGLASLNAQQVIDTVAAKPCKYPALYAALLTSRARREVRS